jgi:hypothetical protein
MPKGGFKTMPTSPSPMRTFRTKNMLKTPKKVVFNR